MKFAFITPRYGAEITHGAEHVCRLLAERVCERHDVDVLTTCVRDSNTWKNEYAEGIDRIRGVVVRRFAAAGGRDADAFRAFTQRLYTNAHSRADELEWVRRTGSTSPPLVDFLRRQHRQYDALVFFSYWAGTTVHGMAVAPERSVLFPCARLEPAMRWIVTQDTLGAPAAVAYCSSAERRLVRAHMLRHPRAEEIVGVGVEPVPEARYPRMEQDVDPPESRIPDVDETEVEARPAPAHLAGRGILFRRRHRLDDRFVLYGGSVEPENGTEEMIEYFASYAEQNGQTPLVLMGVKMMKLPQAPWLRMAGVLADRERMFALEAADVAIAPDPDDLAAVQVLESFAMGTPVLASARNSAAVDHCRRARAGLYYANRDEFVEALRLMMTNDALRSALGQNGRRYVQQHYLWEAVIGRFERVVARARGEKPAAAGR